MSTQPESKKRPDYEKILSSELARTDSPPSLEQTKRASAEDNRKARKKLVVYITGLITAWLAAVMGLLYLMIQPLGDWEMLDSSVLIALLVTTTANVLALMVIILRSLFPPGDRNDTDNQNKPQTNTSNLSKAKRFIGF